MFRIYKNIFVLIILVILFVQIDFFKKTYFTLTRSYENRMISSYEYCGQESIGFLDYVKNNFDINYQIPIKNFADSPNSSWYFSGFNKIDTNKIIFLNFTKDISTNSLIYKSQKYKILYKSQNCYFLEKYD